MILNIIQYIDDTAFRRRALLSRRCRRHVMHYRFTIQAREYLTGKLWGDENRKAKKTRPLLIIDYGTNRSSYKTEQTYSYPPHLSALWSSCIGWMQQVEWTLHEENWKIIRAIDFLDMAAFLSVWTNLLME